MSIHEVKIYGNQASGEGGYAETSFGVKNNPSRLTSHSLFRLGNGDGIGCIYRDGKEKLTTPPTGVKCFGGYHPIKKDGKAYDLGEFKGRPTYTCPMHIREIKTRDMMIEKYSARWYTQIEISENGKRVPLSEFINSNP